MKKKATRTNNEPMISGNSDKSLCPLVVIDPKGLKAMEEPRFSSWKIEVIDPFGVSDETNKLKKAKEAAAIAD